MQISAWNSQIQHRSSSGTMLLTDLRKMKSAKARHLTEAFPRPPFECLTYLPRRLRSHLTAKLQQTGRQRLNLSQMSEQNSVACCLHQVYNTLPATYVQTLRREMLWKCQRPRFSSVSVLLVAWCRVPTLSAFPWVPPKSIVDFSNSTFEPSSSHPAGRDDFWLGFGIRCPLPSLRSLDTEHLL